MKNPLQIHLWILLERVLGKPLLASFVVGVNIIAFNALAELYFKELSYFTYLISCWDVHPLLFLSKIGPPFLIPFMVTSAARIIQRKTSEFNLLEDAIPAIFMALIPQDETHNIHHQAPSKVNPSYKKYFPEKGTISDQEVILPARYWKDPSKRESFFKELSNNEFIEGFKAEFVTTSGTEWKGIIFSQFKQLDNNVKVQGMVIDAEASD